jgi:hypothetical protein
MRRPSPQYSPVRASRRAGSLLIEFALVALVLYLLLAATITFGYLLYAAQSLQTTVDLAAREISRTPLPAVGLTLDDVLHRDTSDPELAPEVQEQLALIRNNIYNPRYLVLDLDELHGRSSLGELIADLPLVNQQLINLMIYDEIGGRRYLRYPGAVFIDPDPAPGESDDPPPTGLLVEIPIIEGYDSNDAPAAIRWVRVVEPIIDPETLNDPDVDDPFLVTSAQRGVVALRINYPFQSAAMSGFRRQPPLPDDPFPPNLSRPILADDDALAGSDDPSGSLVESDFEYSPYAGPYGLGRQAALGRPVRPYRRVLSVQAIYRREVFN